MSVKNIVKRVLGFFRARQTSEDVRIRTEMAENYATYVLGHNGAMISDSKSGYLGRYPDNDVVFNSNVCVASGKIWHGDLDLTKSEAKLQELADRLGEAVYILREHDGRFDNEDSPQLKKAVRKVEPK